MVRKEISRRISICNFFFSSEIFGRESKRNCKETKLKKEKIIILIFDCFKNKV